MVTAILAILPCIARADHGPPEFVDTMKPIMCSNADFVIKELKDTFGESQKELIGLSEDNTIAVTVFRGPDSFSVVEFFTNGLACIISIGKTNGKEPERPS